MRAGNSSCPHAWACGCTYIVIKVVLHVVMVGVVTLHCGNGTSGGVLESGVGAVEVWTWWRPEAEEKLNTTHSSANLPEEERSRSCLLA